MSEIIQDPSSGKLSVTFKGDLQRTLDDLLKEAGFDLRDYDITRTGGRAWSTAMKNPHSQEKNDLVIFAQNQQVHVSLTPKPLPETRLFPKLQEFLDNQEPPPLRAPVLEPTVGLLGVLNLYDVHMDKLPAHFSMNVEAKPIDQLIARLHVACDDLLEECRRRGVTDLVIPFGNDFFNTNGSGNSTVKGTIINNTTSGVEAFIKGVTFMRHLIDKCRDDFRVKVVCVGGNHDRNEVFKGGMVLATQYANDPDVEIDWSLDLVKHHREGRVLLAFDHGDMGRGSHKLIIDRLAAKVPNWSTASCRELHRGHHHREMTFAYQSVTIRYMGSAGVLDQFEVDHMHGDAFRRVSASFYDTIRGFRLGDHVVPMGHTPMTHDYLNSI